MYTHILQACSFSCLSRITAVASSPEGLSFAVGDGAGTFYVRMTLSRFLFVFPSPDLTHNFFVGWIKIFAPVGLSGAEAKPKRILNKHKKKKQSGNNASEKGKSLK